MYWMLQIKIKLVCLGGNIIYSIPHGENFMANFTTLRVIIWFSTGTLGIFATLVYDSTMRVVIYDVETLPRILI